jgi:hypothetical protein
MDTSTIISLAGLIITFTAIAVSFGQLKKQVDVSDKACGGLKDELETCVKKEQLNQVIDRMKEDRDHDNRRFEELYHSRNELRVSVERIEKSIDTVEVIMREFKEDVKKDINGLGGKIERLYERRDYVKD